MNLYEDLTLRTDLADEKEEILKENAGETVSGITVNRKKIKGFDVTLMNVINSDGENATGKPIGRYVTIDVGKIWMSDKRRFSEACEVISHYIEEFVPNDGSCMLAALGNKSIIADAIGPLTAENFIVTRHIKESDEEIFRAMCLRETICISPGVLGNTGLEAAKIIKGAVLQSNPSFIIAVDSLASRKLSRLATTVQICDTGITPGSGINNARKEISSKTLGVPVIAIGVPTVVDVTTLASDIIRNIVNRSENGHIKSYAGKIINEISLNEAENFFVTPKETDHIIKDTSKLIGYSINMALHKGITEAEIDELVF